MKKKRIALLLAVCMLLSLLSACGSGDAGSASPAPAEASAASAAEEPSADPEPAAPAEPAEPEPEAEASLEEPAEPEPEPEVAYVPLEEHTDVTVLFQFASFFQNFFPEGWGASPWWAELGERTNTSWSLREISNMEWQTNVNLLCAANDLPDVVTNFGSVYNGGFVQAIRDEMIIDVAPLLEENAPHYYSKITADEYTLKTCMTDEGEMGAMYAIVQEPLGVTNGLWIRQDWLEGLGKEIPTTPEALKEVLELFRDEYGADVGFYQMIRPNQQTVGVAAEGIWNAFGPTDFFLDEDGNIQYGPVQDYYFEYLSYLRSLAEEGLFLTSDMTDQKSADLFASGGIGVEGDSPDNVPSYIVLLPDEEQAKVKLVPMAALGEPTEYGTPTTWISNDGGGNISISTMCENPEAILHAFDYLFTEEGALLSSYGMEGLSFEYVDGKPQLTDLVMNNPDGIPTVAAKGYWMNPGVPGLVDMKRTQFTWDEVQQSAYGIWNSAYTGSSLMLATDSLSLTQEEQDEIGVFKTDMITYATEWVNGIIFGTSPLDDAAIDTYLDTMYNTMHLQDIIDVYTDAYERFQNRALQ